MKFQQILLEILVNGFALFFLFNAFINLDLLKIPQMFILSTIIMNAYLINKKTLRNKQCNINIKQIGVGLGIGFVNLIILIILKKIFS
jgi:hypothetical protein